MEVHQIQELEDHLLTRKTILYELYTLPGRIKNKKGQCKALLLKVNLPKRVIFPFLIIVLRVDNNTHIFAHSLCLYFYSY